ncbi:MAG TPA: transcriptional repressor LexA [Candidatus Eisenbacteria bacterium]|jgi:repressor LexA
MITPRQRAAYDFIADFLDRNGFAPSFEELRRHLGLASLNAVAKLVAQLRRRGALAPVPANAKRALRPARGPRFALRPRGAGDAPGTGPARFAPFTVPLLGVVAAGAPIEPVEDPEPIQIPAALAGPGERYALRVRGDSMIEDGIRDGDIVVVRRAQAARNGETVVAVVEGEATLKRFHLHGADVTLRPANAALRPITARADRVEIRGVLVGLLRRY